MAVVGIIAEYNPFHHGHAWQIAAIREKLGKETAIVAAMSGNFVQRGDFAFLPKHTRAEMALRGGVDLVLELPTRWSAATAERFALGGVGVLEGTGVVTNLAFGCESQDLWPLERTAACLMSRAYQEHLQKALACKTLSFAKARENACGWLIGMDALCLGRPNNALAVEYLRALNVLASPMEPMALPRMGAEHDSGEEADEFAAASAIRRKILMEEPWRHLVPESTAGLMDRETAAGRGPVRMETVERAVLARLRTLEEEDFRPYDGGGEGLYHRFYGAVHSESGVEAILTAAKTRRYPLARLRRMLLHSYLGLRPTGERETPGYLRVLGATERGRALLGRMRTGARLPVITKPADARILGEAVWTAVQEEARYTDLYTLAYPDLAQSRPGSEFTQNPVML